MAGGSPAYIEKTDAVTQPTAQSAALERVLRQVLEMKDAGDIQHLIREVWDVLDELDFDFLSCAIVLIDEESDWLSSYNVWAQETVATFYRTEETLRHTQHLDDGLIMFAGQTSLSEAPALYQDAIAAWQAGRIERHLLSAAEIEEIARLNTQRYGGSMPADTYPIRFHLHVPFPHGVFSLRTGRDEIDQFADHQIEFLQRLVNTISIGYDRYRDFRRLDRDRTVQRLRAEVQAMQSSDDIVGLMGQLWEVLQRGDIDFRYMSIAVADGEADDVHLYAAASDDRRDTIGNFPLLQREIAADVDLYYRLVPRQEWEELHTEFTGIHRVGPERMAAYAKRTAQLWGIDPGLTDIVNFVGMSMMAAALPQGRIFVADMQDPGQPPLPDFTPQDQETLAAFADALGLGFTRFFDFQRLERHNRDLEVQRSVDRVRAEVASMRHSTDIGDVAVLLGEQLTGLGVEFMSCSFSIIDEEAGVARYYAMGPNDYTDGVKNVTRVDRSMLGDLIDMEDCLVAIPDIIPGHSLFYTTEPLSDAPAFADRGRPPRLTHRTQEEAERELDSFRRRWRTPDFLLSRVPRSVIRVPFSHGSIAVAHFEPDRFNQSDVDLVAVYADAVSLGFTRFHDFQRLERYNRDLEIQQSVDRVRAEVASMRQSTDLGDVALLFGEQLNGLGVEFTSCSFSIIDEDSGLVRYYALAPTDYLQYTAEVTRLDRSALGELIDMEDCIAVIPDILPEFDLIYTTEALQEAPAFADRGLPPRLVRRSEAEAQIELANFRRRWRAPEYPLSSVPRSVIRVPFSHGSLALIHFEPDRFSQSDVDLVAEYADAVSLGFTRFHDFQRLERRNRELETERAVEQLQIAVQSMKSSGDIVPIMALLSQELQGLGLDYSWSSITIVDEEAGRVRVYGTVGFDMSSTGWDEFLRRSGQPELAFGPDTIERLETEAGPFFITGITGSTVDHANYTSAPLDSYHGRIQQIDETTAVVRTESEAMAATEEYQRIYDLGTSRWPEELMLRSILRTPFSGGTIAISRNRPEAFGPHEARILERFAEAFSLGYARYLDFRNLERRNRELQIERAVEQVQIAVQSMKVSADILPVITLLSQELQSLNLDYSWCTISLVDDEADRVRVYGTAGTDSFGQSVQWKQLVEEAGHQELAFGSDTMQRLESEDGPFFIVGIPGLIGYANYMAAPLDSYHGGLQQATETTIVSRTEEEARAAAEQYARRWKVSFWGEHMWLRSTLRTPFAGGTIALSHRRRDALGQREARVLERFAEAFSLGYARYLDFRSLERRNRELELERAVGRVQIAVQNMTTSTDLLHVMPLLFEEMQRLGFDYRYFSVSIVDEAVQRVRVHVTGDVHWPMRIVHRLDVEDLPADVISQMDGNEPMHFVGRGADGREVFIHYMSAPLDAYHGRQQQTRQTTITSRTDEELAAVLPQIMQYWKYDSWPTEYMPRSVLRVPFAGGTIALTDSRPDFFAGRDARILERFAEAFTLGYTRSLDFRRLEEQNRALEAASRIKSEFLANMSHELRTPMNAITNFASMVLDGVCGDISDDVRDVVGEIDDNGERLLELINDVLDLSKIEAGAMQLERAPCDPAACVENAAGAMEHGAREKGLQLRTQIEEMPSLLADERRLTQHVLINLAKNAIKFTEAGSVEIGVRRDEGDVLFWVRDTGIGIAEADQERIFETFHQVDTSMTRQTEGTGLGLAIARKFVELHRGRIWVDSEEGVGSTFSFAIPAST